MILNLQDFFGADIMFAKLIGTQITFSCRFGLDTSDGDKNKYLEYSMSSDWDINSCDVEIGILMNEIEVRTFYIMVCENLQLDIWMSYYVNLVLTILMKIKLNFLSPAQNPLRKPSPIILIS